MDMICVARTYCYGWILHVLMLRWTRFAWAGQYVLLRLDSYTNPTTYIYIYICIYIYILLLFVFIHMEIGHGSSLNMNITPHGISKLEHPPPWYSRELEYNSPWQLLDRTRTPSIVHRAWIDFNIAAPRSNTHISTISNKSQTIANHEWHDFQCMFHKYIVLHRYSYNVCTRHPVVPCIFHASTYYI